LPTTANVDARDFKHLACWLIVEIGPISLNVTMPGRVLSEPIHENVSPRSPAQFDQLGVQFYEATTSHRSAGPGSSHRLR
jgi:hypothetical protein